MSDGFKHKVDGQIDKAKGEAKDRIGKARDDFTQQAEGKMEKAKGDMKKKAGELKDRFDGDSSK